MSLYRFSIAAVVVTLFLGLLAGCGGGGGNSGTLPTYYTLTLTVTGTGTITSTLKSGSTNPNYYASAGVNQYLSGSVVELTAIPASGWAFDHWGGDLTTGGSQQTITIDAAKNVSATFIRTTVPGSLTVTAVTGNNGPTSIGSWQGRQVYFGSSVHNNAEGDIQSGTPSYTLTTAATTLNSSILAPRPSGMQMTNTSRLHSQQLYHQRRMQINADQQLRLREQQLLQRRIPQRQRTRPRAAVTVGTRSTFYVELVDMDVTLGQTRPATCRKVGTHCYIFVDDIISTDDPVFNATAINTLANYFDTVAYPKVTSLFSDTNDTDGDTKLYIVCSPLQRDSGSWVAGYFSAIDKYLKTDFENSNEHDMFYLTVPKSTNEFTALLGTLAHEFQHMVNFDRHYLNNASSVEATWLNESLSQLASFICTDTTDIETIKEYLGGHTCSLTFWDFYDLNGDVMMNYASAQLFSIYLYDRFYNHGQPLFMRRLVNNTLLGTRNVANVTGYSFNSLFQDWVAALVLSDTGVTTDPKYQYTSFNLRSNGMAGLKAPVWNVGTPNTTSASVLPYTPNIRTLSNISNNTALNLTGSSSAGFLIALPTN